MDWPGLCAALAARYVGLSNAAGTSTLRAAHDVAPDNIVTPCAVARMGQITGIALQGATFYTGRAAVDVLILLDPASDVPHRDAALLEWIRPAMTAAVGGIGLGMYGDIAGATVSSVEPILAGSEDNDYAGMPYDMVRVRYDIEFLERVTVTL